MPRKTRRRMAGGKQEDAERREREEELRNLAQELHREQQNRYIASDASSGEETAEPNE